MGREDHELARKIKEIKSEINSKIAEISSLEKGDSSLSHLEIELDVLKSQLPASEEHHKQALDKICALEEDNKMIPELEQNIRELNDLIDSKIELHDKSVEK